VRYDSVATNAVSNGGQRRSIAAAKGASLLSHSWLPLEISLVGTPCGGRREGAIRRRMRIPLVMSQIQWLIRARCPFASRRLETLTSQRGDVAHV
jgi:hypothetical protein